MCWAAGLKKLSREELMKPSLKNKILTFKRQQARRYSARSQRLGILNLTLILLFSVPIPSLIDILSISGQPCRTALAESGESDQGVNTDKRPVRVAPDGTEIVDYISELEQSNDALEQQIRSLKEQLARQNSGTIDYAGSSTSNSVQERDLLVANPHQAQKDSVERLRAKEDFDSSAKAKAVELKEKSVTHTESTDALKTISLESHELVDRNLEQAGSIPRPVGNNPKIDNEASGTVPSRKPQVEDPEMAPQEDLQRYIAPILPVVVDEDLSDQAQDDTTKSVDFQASGHTGSEQVRARLSDEGREESRSINPKDHFHRMGAESDFESELAKDAGLGRRAPKQQKLNIEGEDLRSLEEQDQDVADEDSSLESDTNETLGFFTQDAPQRVVSNDSAILDAKRRVRTDVSTLISLLATREQLFSRFGSQGGQIQISPSRLVTQRGETFESVRARQESAITIRDWKVIEADLAELRKIAERDISFIRRYSRRNPS